MEQKLKHQITDINSEDRLVQTTFTDHLHNVLGWDTKIPSGQASANERMYFKLRGENP